MPKKVKYCIYNDYLRYIMHLQSGLDHRFHRGVRSARFEVKLVSGRLFALIN